MKSNPFFLFSSQTLDETHVYDASHTDYGTHDGYASRSANGTHGSDANQFPLWKP